ncbi:MAG TPA: hypothetical protein VGU69_10625 [Rhizomicrobium sp.]|nr:hypothetical protein [Rhizomicrobium sp.]
MPDDRPHHMHASTGPIVSRAGVDHLRQSKAVLVVGDNRAALADVIEAALIVASSQGQRGAAIRRLLDAIDRAQFVADGQE